MRLLARGAAMAVMAASAAADTTGGASASASIRPASVAPNVSAVASRSCASSASRGTRHGVAKPAPSQAGPAAPVGASR